MKLLTIVGISGSGKTTVAETLIRGLRDRGRSVASAKSIACGSAFTIDTPGTNSYRHRQAGSQLVITRAAAETAVLFQEDLPLSSLLPFFAPFDYVILEGDYDAPVPRVVTGVAPDDARERLDHCTFAVSGRVAAALPALEGIPAFDVTTPHGAAALVALAERSAGEVSL